MEVYQTHGALNPGYMLFTEENNTSVQHDLNGRYKDNAMSCERKHCYMHYTGDSKSSRLPKATTILTYAFFSFAAYSLRRNETKCQPEMQVLHG
jgi:hypothetical protein